MNAARNNAQRLATDARTLFEAKRYPTAASLAILSIEESGKITILRQLSLAESDDEVRNCWKEYRSHTKKNFMTFFLQFVSNNRRLSDFAPLFTPDSENPSVVDIVKQLGFYTDCLSNEHWSIPAEVIDKTAAATLCFTATLLAKHEKDVTTREIELWIKFMNPVIHMDSLSQKTALSNWCAAMQDEGLIPPGENEMEKFVFGKAEL
jgi:AbiV family abortive infection protein